MSTLPSELPVEVVRSRKRKKTSSARIVDGVIQVRIPAWLSKKDERTTVEDLVGRVRRAREIADRGVDLTERSRMLASRYGLPQADAVRWVSNQNQRWGSCTPTTREIRISSRLRNAPGYVLDYVLVHELAHLVEHGHGERFKMLERRFPKWERAEGFLEAMSFGAAAARYCAD